ncbi:hypothetical protein THAOC_04293 [Thalassiosira oceanica]|uniref:Uncharacterized protein n=1 Tax=Thalassiosira oceanica TaxID=159749 RepID=K0T5K7_THAOC|nr:hypothetical protein THAOC_04293 [Thalassiosira oceanica]|eukprot:EJK74058.1 hypothetical protein THAOC_04293 [Thalassiosira oceanica]
MPSSLPKAVFGLSPSLGIRRAGMFLHWMISAKMGFEDSLTLIKEMLKKGHAAKYFDPLNINACLRNSMPPHGPTGEHLSVVSQENG